MRNTENNLDNMNAYYKQVQKHDGERNAISIIKQMLCLKSHKSHKSHLEFRKKTIHFQTRIFFLIDLVFL